MHSPQGTPSSVRAAHSKIPTSPSSNRLLASRDPSLHLSPRTSSAFPPVSRDPSTATRLDFSRDPSLRPTLHPPERSPAHLPPPHPHHHNPSVSLTPSLSSASSFAGESSMNAPSASFVDPAFAAEIDSSLVHQARSLQIKLALTEAAHTEAQEKISEMETILEVLKKQYDRSTMSEARLEERVWDLELLNEQLQTQIATLESQIQRTTTETRHLEQELRICNDQIEHLKATEIACTANFEKARTKLEAEAASCRRQVYILQKDKTDLTRKLDEMRELMKRNVPAYTRFTPSEEISGGWGGISDSEDDASSSARGSVGRSGSPEQRASMQIQSLTQSLMHSHEQVKQLTTSKTKLEGEVKELKVMLSEAQETIEGLRGQIETQKPPAKRGSAAPGRRSREGTHVESSAEVVSAATGESSDEEIHEEVMRWEEIVEAVESPRDLYSELMMLRGSSHGSAATNGTPLPPTAQSEEDAAIAEKLDKWNHLIIGMVNSGMESVRSTSVEDLVELGSGETVRPKEDESENKAVVKVDSTVVAAADRRSSNSTSYTVEEIVEDASNIQPLESAPYYVVEEEVELRAEAVSPSLVLLSSYTPTSTTPVPAAPVTPVTAPTAPPSQPNPIPHLAAPAIPTSRRNSSILHNSLVEDVKLADVMQALENASKGRPVLLERGRMAMSCMDLVNIEKGEDEDVVHPNGAKLYLLGNKTKPASLSIDTTTRPHPRQHDSLTREELLAHLSGLSSPTTPAPQSASVTTTTTVVTRTTKVRRRRKVVGGDGETEVIEEEVVVGEDGKEQKPQEPKIVEKIVERIVEKVVEVPVERKDDEEKIQQQEAVESLTATMIGSFFQKFNRNGKKPKMRYFWVHPYTRTLSWAPVPPSQGGAKQVTKSAPIDSFEAIEPPTPTPSFPPTPAHAININSRGRVIKLVPTTWSDRTKWVEGLTLMLSRTSAGPPTEKKLVRKVSGVVSGVAGIIASSVASGLEEGARRSAGRRGVVGTRRTAEAVVGGFVAAVRNRAS
ncbi:meiotic cell cortex C-terminal pleckstrin homology-domain-containing protein [Cladochytrium replicatum]|nr:meiotic cell cortex C-terminal pleckstrin homology-domain-containing protein [Cladochytrium replicatum]